MTINNCFKVRVRDLILSAAAGLCLVFALPAQATTLKVLKRFDATGSASFLQNDWNPANGNTYWGAIAVYNYTGADPADYSGTYVVRNFSAGEDPWETVSIKSPAGQQFDLRGTKEIQLVTRPQYVTERPYVTIVLRVAMQDGSIWDQPKVMANNVWQTAVFPVKEDSFSRAEWGPPGCSTLAGLPHGKLSW